MNILLSKSEVLSLSVLESSLHGLPSLVNRNLETKEIEILSYQLKQKLKILKKN